MKSIEYARCVASDLRDPELDALLALLDQWAILVPDPLSLSKDPNPDLPSGKFYLTEVGIEAWYSLGNHPFWEQYEITPERIAMYAPIHRVLAMFDVGERAPSSMAAVLLHDLVHVKHAQARHFDVANITRASMIEEDWEGYHVQCKVLELFPGYPDVKREILSMAHAMLGAGAHLSAEIFQWIFEHVLRINHIELFGVGMNAEVSRAALFDCLEEVWWDIGFELASSGQADRKQAELDFTEWMLTIRGVPLLP